MLDKIGLSQLNFHYLHYSTIATMLKFLAFMLCILSSIFVDAQDNFITQNGKVHFYSKTPLEDIEANTQSAIGVLYTATKKVQAKIPIQSFEFKQKLMQEHFNENYLESDKYPYGNLDATIVENIDFTRNGVYDITISGILDIHGIKKPRDIKAKLTIADGMPKKATATFDIKLVEHKIKIPKAVILNIAEVITVDINFDLVKYQK